MLIKVVESSTWMHQSRIYSILWQGRWVTRRFRTNKQRHHIRQMTDLRWAAKLTTHRHPAPASWLLSRAGLPAGYFGRETLRSSSASCLSHVRASNKQKYTFPTEGTETHPSQSSVSHMLIMFLKRKNKIKQLFFSLTRYDLISTQK